MSSIPITALLLAALTWLPAAPAEAHVAEVARGEDLRKAYPATMSWSQSGLFPVCTAEDVWELKSFELELGKSFSIATGRAVVAFGRHETNVLWAAVFPEEPAEIVTLQSGGGEHAKTIFLRFAPGAIGEVFPAKTVAGRGSPWTRAEAGRLARHKIGWKWSTPAGNPTVVQPGWCLVDVDTVEGGRRSYALDRNSSTLEYNAEVESKPLPPSPPIEPKEAAEAFEEVWGAFDSDYAGFVLLPKLDWDKQKKAYARPAGEAKTVHELGAVLAELLAQLEDLHVWVKVGDDFIPGYNRERPLNANWKATRALASADQKNGDELHWGRTEDGIGYLAVMGLSDQGLTEQFDSALERLADTWGLIVDLRFNGGGDEVLGRTLAARFVDEPRVYSLNQYRAGSKHSSLGPKLERKFEPRGPWRYTAPVIVLWGRKTMSSAESLALMFAQCPQVTTMGDLSAGSSGNPRRIELDCGITVNKPTWLDMDPDGNPIEHVGTAPDVIVKADPSDFTDTADPVMEAALERLRKTPKSKRKPAKE